MELIFKTYKSSFRLADLPSANTHIILSLVYVALVASIIAHPVATTLALEWIEEKRTTPSLQRAGAIFLHVCPGFIHFLKSGTKDATQILINKLTLFKQDLFDPNHNKRESSIDHPWIES